MAAMPSALLLLTLLLSVAPRSASDDAQALQAAVRKGDVVGLAALLRAGADPSAATPRGWTSLTEAASRGDLAIARQLLDAGADPDARDRRAASALDVAEAAKHDDVARLLRSRGSRGSGKSVGDLVCVLPWNGSGFCGAVEAIDGTRYRLRVTRLVGCRDGCVPEAACSAGRPLGGNDPGRADLGDSLWIRSWCLTHTGLARDARP